MTAAGDALSYVSPLLFVGGWLGITALISLLSGWAELARGYRGHLATVDREVWLGSGWLNRFGLPMHYGRCLQVATGPDGVQLSLFPIFAFMSPTLVIPWEHVVRSRRYTRFGVCDRFSFYVSCELVKVTLAGRAARMLEAEFKRLNPGRPVHEERRALW